MNKCSYVNRSTPNAQPRPFCWASRGLGEEPGSTHSCPARRASARIFGWTGLNIGPSTAYKGQTTEVDAVIEVQHLTKRYGPFTAVDDVSFKVERGEILGFLGPNGAGKTTTMRILTGYMPPTDGKAIVAGYDVIDQPLDAKRRTGYLPETPPLYTDMTVVDYLMFCASIKGV